jgi:L-lactate dehydrogenase complex protein LldG
VSAREEILARVRDALRDVPEDETPDDVPVPRDYLTAHVPDDPRALADLLAVNLADYRAHVHRCAPAELPATIAGLLDRHGSTSVGVPADLPPEWLSGLSGHAGGVRQVPDSPDLTARELDAVESVVTGCALAIAETGTIVLDAGPGQGRRMLTLVPDHHICVVRAPEQIVASVPLALPRLDPTRPQTWISGPSATSDIELDRVEGVHGPRVLDVVLVAED